MKSTSISLIKCDAEEENLRVEGKDYRHIIKSHTKVVFGAHPKTFASYHPKPVFWEEFDFCLDHNIFDLLSKLIIDLGIRSHVEKVNEPEYKEGQGNFITVTEMIKNSRGRYFNIQLDEDQFLTVLSRLPASIRAFDEIVEKSWRILTK